MGWGANLSQMGLGPPAVPLPAKPKPGLATAPGSQSPKPVQPIKLPPNHAWKPIPPVAFTLPKEPLLKSSQGHGKIAMVKPKLSTSLGAKVKAIKA